MAKVRFYCDVPEYGSVAHGYQLCAGTVVPSHTPIAGWKRIAFDVEMPPGVLRTFDEPAQASNAHVTISEEAP